MKFKKTAGLVMAATMVLAFGPVQASCVHHQPGWHMVSKRCNFKHAENWQEYTSGAYVQPSTKNMMMLK